MSEQEKPSRWSGAFNKAKEAAKNFDAKATMEKAKERALHAKERIIETYESERTQQLLSTLGEIATSPEAIKVIESLPFATGLKQMVEAAKGSTFEHETLSTFGRFKHAARGAKNIAFDAMGTEERKKKTENIGKALLESSPDMLSRVGDALKSKDVKGADTVVALAEIVQTNPNVTNFFTRKFAPKP